MNRFNKGQDITTEGKKYTCICCDDEFAVFCELKEGEGGAGFSIDFTAPFVVSNLKDFVDGFEYELVKEQSA